MGDVIVSADAAATLAEVVPSGIVMSWVPPDLANTIPADSQDPLVVYRDPAVWTYNSEKYDSCPVDNIWALTDPEWNRKVALSDPLNKPGYLDWFNQMETHWDQSVADAYEMHYGKALDTGTPERDRELGPGLRFQFTALDRLGFCRVRGHWYAGPG